jgi:hypothetical protein
MVGRWRSAERANGFLQEILRAAEFLGVGVVTLDAGFFELSGVVAAARIEVSRTKVEIRVGDARERLAAGAFVAPGSIGFGCFERPRKVGAPTSDGVLGE